MLFWTEMWQYDFAHSKGVKKVVVTFNIVKVYYGSTSIKCKITMSRWCFINFHLHMVGIDTVEPRYNEDLGTMKITLL